MKFLTPVAGPLPAEIFGVITTPAIIAGQFEAKFIGGLLWSFVLRQSAKV